MNDKEYTLAGCGTYTCEAEATTSVMTDAGKLNLCKQCAGVFAAGRESRLRTRQAMILENHPVNFQCRVTDACDDGWRVVPGTQGCGYIKSGEHTIEAYWVWMEKEDGVD